jgi:chromosome segregation ATPase
MTASSEALALIGLVADAGKFSAKLQELAAATEASEKAAKALEAAEKASAANMAAKLEVQETLLASLTAQTNEITERNVAAEAKLAAREKEVAEREAAVTEREQKTADEAQRALQELTNRDQELSLKQYAIDEHAAAQTRSLHEGQAGLSARHLELRQIIGEARRGIAGS